jgi:SAM-dependent methyltransferase
MPFDDACFDGAYSMNVSMNIEDRAGLYREIHRVLKPGGWLLLSELALGPAGVEPDYPTPWAETAASSFLMTQPDTEAGLKAAGFTISRSDIMTPQAKAYGVKLKEIADRGGKSPSRAVELVHGEATAEIAPNMARAMTERRIVPIEIFCTKDSA